MHVTAKKMAFSGLMLAFTIVCIALGSVIETNTLFLLAVSSYFVGIVLRETGAGMGAAFYLAGVFLGFIVSPNKLYVLSYGAMGLYILLNEILYRWIGRMKSNVDRKAVFWCVKYMVFNLMYIPMLLGFQKLLFGKEISAEMMFFFVAAGQAGFFLYDRAYEYVQGHVWNRIRGKIGWM